MEKRQPIFLAEPRWIQKPFFFHTKGRGEVLQDITLRIPLLLFQTDGVLSDLSAPYKDDRNCNSDFDGKHTPVTEIARSLLRRFSEVRSALDEWLECFRQAYSTPLWWNTNAVMDNVYSTTDPECIPNLQDLKYQLRFPDGQKAAMLMTYWSCMLELLIAVIDICATLLGLPQANANCLRLRIDLQNSRATAEEMASLIIQATPYVFSCLEGRFAAQLPLRTVARYHNRRSDLSHVQKPGAG